MSVSSERYRLYLDESGDHVFREEKALREPPRRYLALCGCCLLQGPVYESFHHALEDLKRKYFPRGLDDPPVVLHREDLVRATGPFWRLRDPSYRQEWDREVVELIRRTQFLVMGVVLDKLAMKERYLDPFHPYDFGVSLLLERFCGYLNHWNRTGDVLAEARGKQEDDLLNTTYRSLYERGTKYHSEEFLQRCLTSREMKFRKKHHNVAGLQLSDLLARPLREYVTLRSGLSSSKPSTFDEVMFDILEQKFHRKIDTKDARGYGWVLFPK